MKLQVNLDFPGVRQAIPAATEWQVERMDWALPGGCQQAFISTQLQRNDQLDLRLLEKCLAKSLTIQQATGELMWDGWVDKISLSCGHLRFVWDLRHHHNRVLARYPSVSANLDPYHQWVYGSWQQDEQLLQDWGAKEQLHTLEYGNPASAQQAASQQLSRSVKMISSHLLKEAENTPSLEISARGWWQRLDWTLDGEEDGLLAHIKGGKNKLPFGLPDNQKVAQKFQTGNNAFPAGQICFRLVSLGSPVDEVRVRICSDQADIPGTTLASTSLPAYQLQVGWQWHTWQMEAPITLAANSPYWLVVERSGSLNLENSYMLESDEGLGYPQEVCKRWNGSAWTRLNENLRFAVLAVSESSRLIQEVGNQLVAGGVLRGVQIWQESGVYLARWRAPEKTRQQRLEGWLQLGCQTGQPYSAVVNSGRILELFTLPRMEGFPLFLTDSGRLRSPAGVTLPSPLELLGRQLNLQIGLQSTSQVLNGLKWTIEDGLFPLLSEPE